MPHLERFLAAIEDVQKAITESLGGPEGKMLGVYAARSGAVQHELH
jgi:hypothetical protein